MFTPITTVAHQYAKALLSPSSTVRSAVVPRERIDFIEAERNTDELPIGSLTECAVRSRPRVPLHRPWPYACWVLKQSISVITLLINMIRLDVIDIDIDYPAGSQRFGDVGMYRVAHAVAIAGLSSARCRRLRFVNIDDSSARPDTEV